MCFIITITEGVKDYYNSWDENFNTIPLGDNVLTTSTPHTMYSHLGFILLAVYVCMYAIANLT